MKKIRILPLLLLFLLSSCKKEGKLWWDADFAGPVASSSLSISNLVADSIISVDPDSSLRVVLNETIFNFAIDSLLAIPDTTIDTSYIAPIGGINFTSGQQIFSSPPTETSFGINGASISFLQLKKGVIKLEAFNSIAEPVTLTYDLLNTDLAGNPLTIVQQVPSGSIPSPGSSVSYITIDGLSMQLSGIGGNKLNTLVTKSTVDISPNANPGTINVNEGISIKLTFMDVIPLYAKGYLGSQLFTSTNETIDFDFFKGITAQQFSLQSASVNLKLTNGFGADVSASGIQFVSMNSSNGNTVTLAGSGVNSAYNLNRATFNPASPNPVSPSVKLIPLNNSNSNIQQFIENLPDKISYSATTQVNPLGNISGNNDFVYYGNGLRADLEMDIPLAFSASQLTLKDTSVFSLSDVSSIDNINHGRLNLRVTNGFPFSTGIQAYLLNEQGSLIDSLFANPNVAVAGFLNGNLIVTQPSLSILEIPLSESKINNLKLAKQVVFKAVMNTVSNPQIVKLYDHYRMDFVLTAELNYSVNKP
jgi:hypothetical protein